MNMRFAFSFYKNISFGSVLALLVLAGCGKQLSQQEVENRSVNKINNIYLPVAEKYKTELEIVAKSSDKQKMKDELVAYIYEKPKHLSFGDRFLDHRYSENQVPLHKYVKRLWWALKKIQSNQKSLKRFRGQQALALNAQLQKCYKDLIEIQKTLETHADYRQETRYLTSLPRAY